MNMNMNANVSTRLCAALWIALVSGCASCATIPVGTPEGADDLARKIEASVNKDAWDKTGAVKFAFRKNLEHVWDKERGFFYSKKGDDETWLDLWDRGGFARRAGVDVTDEATKAQMLDQAWKFFCNSTFWLNPLVKLFDSGTSRELVTLDDGRRGLKVAYASGGATPGDTYVWIVDESKDPIVVAVKMWVSALPTKGIEFTWTDWATLATGAKIGVVHNAVGVIAVTLDDPQGAANLAALAVEPSAGTVVKDHFAALVARRSKTE